MIKYKVTLTKDEHDELMSIISKGSHSSQQFRTAYILLNCDEGEYGEKIYDPEFNISLAYNNYYKTRGWTPWYAVRGILW